MALIVLDASVLIALLDPADALHHAATEAIEKHAADDLKIPASAYSESLVGPARRGQAEAAKSAIASLLLDIVRSPIGSPRRPLSCGLVMRSCGSLTHW